MSQIEKLNKMDLKPRFSVNRRQTIKKLALEPNLHTVLEDLQDKEKDKAKHQESTDRDAESKDVPFEVKGGKCVPKITYGKLEQEDSMQDLIEKT